MAVIDFSRSDDSIIGKWWWSIDRWLLFAFFGLILFGFVMAMAATPMVAERIGFDKLYFVKRHFFYILPAVLIMFFTSMLDDRQVKSLCFLLSLKVVLAEFCSGSAKT